MTFRYYPFYSTVMGMARACRQRRILGAFVFKQWKTRRSCHAAFEASRWLQIEGSLDHRDVLGLLLYFFRPALFAMS